MKKFSTTAAFCLVIFLVHHNHAATIRRVELTKNETEIQDTEAIQSVSQVKSLVKPEPEVEITKIEAEIQKNPEHDSVAVKSETTEVEQDEDEENSPTEVVTVDSRVNAEISTETPLSTDEETKKPVDNSLSGILKQILQTNITINLAGAEKKDEETVTIGQLMDHLDITEANVEKNLEDLHDTVSDVYDEAMSKFNYIVSEVKDVMSSYDINIGSEINISREETKVSIPGLFSLNSNRKDGTFLGIEKGEKTSLKIPGILELKLEDTVDAMNTDDVNFLKSDDVIYISAVDGGARIQSPLFDLKFGNVANKIILN